MATPFEKLGVSGFGLLIFIVYGFVVAFFSLTPVDDVFISIWDKLLHFGCYGMFALIAWWGATRDKTFYVLCAVVIAYSALMEVGQSFVPGRMMSGLDIVANTLGVAVVAAVYVLCERWFGAKL
jgi:VanZ family protein|tara:strand:+ start:907 stop:1278 length:372 start_codon:yes stop_codon:yes gene_type:complete